MITVDARGEQCPIPVVKTQKAISALTTPQTVEVLVDNEIAASNVSRLAAGIGAQATVENRDDKEYRILIEVNADALTEQPAEIACTPCADKGDFVVVVSSETMGIGDDALGKVLIKGYLYALSQLDVLPKKILFYNGGVKLTTEGSASLEDLKNMEAQGVEILSCGTCLDFYGLKDKLAVGSVTNMYAIVEATAQARKVIRP